MGLPLLGAAMSLFGGILGNRAQSRAADKATEAQERASRDQIALARETAARQRRDFEPYRAAGGRGLAAYDFEMGLGARPAGYGGFTATPGYDYRMQEGARALEGTSAAQGNSLSGATLAALTRMRTGEATGMYDNHMARLQGLVGVGQASAAQQATATLNQGSMINDAIGSRGNAQAAGSMAKANGFTDMINTGIGLMGYQNPFGQNPQGGGFTASGQQRPMSRPGQGGGFGNIFSGLFDRRG